MLQKYQRQRNIKSFCCPITSQERVGMAARAANLSTVRLSSGISANILDFRLPQKHVLGDVMMEAGCKAGAGEGHAY
jgi:hypothetical protein